MILRNRSFSSHFIRAFFSLYFEDASFCWMMPCQPSPCVCIDTNCNRDLLYAILSVCAFVIVEGVPLSLVGLLTPLGTCGEPAISPSSAKH